MFRHQELDHDELRHEDDATVVSVESDREDTTIEQESAGLPRARTNIEAVMGLLAAFVIGLPAPLVAAVAVGHLPMLDPTLVFVLSLLTFSVTAYLCATVVSLAARAIEGDRSAYSFSIASVSRFSVLAQQTHIETYIPLALAMAIRLPQWWWAAMRPLIALWWLAHFIVAALFGHMAGRQLIGANNPGLLTISTALAVTMAFLFAANLYLMLAIAVGFPRPRIWLIAWRYRLFFDLVVTVAMIAWN